MKFGFVDLTIVDKILIGLVYAQVNRVHFLNWQIFCLRLLLGGGIWGESDDFGGFGVDFYGELNAMTLTPLVPGVVLHEYFEDVPDFYDLAEEARAEGVEHGVGLPRDVLEKSGRHLVKRHVVVVNLGDGQLQLDVLGFVGSDSLNLFV